MGSVFGGGGGIDTSQASYSKIMTDALRTQIRLMPEVLAAERRFQPSFTDLNISQLNQALGGLTGIYEGVQPRLSELQKRIVEQNIAQQQAHLPGFVQQYRQAAGTADILSGLQTRAQEQLAAGSSLTPEEERIAQQQARGAYASRGMGATNRAIGAEILNQYGLGQERMRQRQAYAQNVANQLEASGVPQYYQTTYQPMTLQAISGMGQQAGGIAAGRQFQPESQMAADITAANLNAQAQMAAAKTAAQGGVMGGLLSAGGMLGAAAII